MAKENTNVELGGRGSDLQNQSGLTKDFVWTLIGSAAADTC